MSQAPLKVVSPRPGQDTLNLTHNMDVFRNGVRLSRGTDFVVSGTTFDLVEPPAEGDTIQAVYYGVPLHEFYNVPDKDPELVFSFPEPGKRASFLEF